MASVETQPDGREKQQTAERRRSRDRNHEPEQRDDDASQPPPCRRERAGDTAGDARSSRCDRLELAAAAGRALARPELCHRSILSPAPDGPDPVDYRPEIRPVLCGPGRRIFLQPAPKPAPKATFRSLKSAYLQGESEYRYRDSNPGFRRERAPEHPAASRKMRDFQGKYEFVAIPECPKCSGDVRIWFGRLFFSRSRYRAPSTRRMRLALYG